MNFLKRIYCKFEKDCCRWNEYKILKTNEIKLKLSRKSIESLKNKYANKRCFIIGNGPSLTADDLNKLNNEFCFGTHKIYKIFDKTEWRPDIYCAQDMKLINESCSDINSMKNINKIIAIDSKEKYEHLKNVKYINFFVGEFYPNYPEFSEDMVNGIYEGYTVTYMCLQIAVYMGFKEIYLLGVDHNYSIQLNEKGEVERNGDVKDHFGDDYVITNVLPQTFKSSLAYEAARKYADEHGIKIYNATRGGMLEAFERVDFDEIV